MRIPWKYRLVLFLQLLVLTSIGQNSRPIHFSCSFLDDSAGVFVVPTKILTSKNDDNKIAKQNSIIPKVDLELSTNDTLLYFYSAGFSKMSLPIIYHGKFIKESFANYTFTFSKSKNKINENNIIIYCKPQDFLETNKYELIHLLNDKIHCIQNISPFIKNKEGFANSSIGELSNESYFKILITNSIGKTVTSTKYKFKKGLNLIDLNFYTERDSSKINIEILTINPLERKRIIDFDKGKFDLKDIYFSTLDSISNFMKFYKNNKISIYGFAENIGDTKLNIILAENRAITVFNYLLNQGIEKNRINENWKKNYMLPNEKHLESGLQRKVEITEID